MAAPLLVEVLPGPIGMVAASVRARLRTAGSVALSAVLLGAAAPPSTARIETSDVGRFYAVYDSAAARPTAAALQVGYLDVGTASLRQFVDLRHVTAASLAAAVAKRPEIFARARGCQSVLPGVRRRVQAALARLGRIDPQASFPPVTLLVGEGRTAGTTSAAGVLMGMETVCGADWMEPDLESRFVHLIAHEYIHVQQPAAQTDPVAPTLLFVALVEGGAEFLGQMISGDVGNTQLVAWTRGREGDVERRFLAAAPGGDLSAWLYNGRGTEAWPGDLGYWAGYRIVKAYYLHAPDKRRAIDAILHVDAANAAAFLKDSGWTPGMTLPDKVSPPP